MPLGLPRCRVWPSSCRTSRPLVLASLRALHLDLRLRRRQGGSDRGMASPAPGTSRSRRWFAGRGRRVVTGPGSGLSEEPVSGVQSGRAGDRVVPRLPSRAPGARRGAPGVGLQAGEDGVADLPFQRAQGFFRGLALGQLLVVVRAALAVPVADLGDRHHVDGVIEPPVPAPAQPVDLALARGHLDRRGPVVGGEVARPGNRDTSRTSPMTVAATTGPTPNSPVRLVPAAATTTASFFLASRSWASMRRRSSRKAAASSHRAAATASGRVIDPRMCAAWPAVIALEAPPGTSWHSTACSRQTTGCGSGPDPCGSWTRPSAPPRDHQA